MAKTQVACREFTIDVTEMSGLSTEQFVEQSGTAYSLMPLQRDFAYNEAIAKIAQILESEVSDQEKIAKINQYQAQLLDFCKKSALVKLAESASVEVGDNFTILKDLGNLPQKDRILAVTLDSFYEEEDFFRKLPNQAKLALKILTSLKENKGDTEKLSSIVEYFHEHRKEALFIAAKDIYRDSDLVLRDADTLQELRYIEKPTDGPKKELLSDAQKRSVLLAQRRDELKEVVALIDLTTPDPFADLKKDPYHFTDQDIDCVMTTVNQSAIKSASLTVTRMSTSEIPGMPSLVGGQGYEELRIIYKPKQGLQAIELSTEVTRPKITRDQENMSVIERPVIGHLTTRYDFQHNTDKQDRAVSGIATRPVKITVKYKATDPSGAIMIPAGATFVKEHRVDGWVQRLGRRFNKWTENITKWWEKIFGKKESVQQTKTVKPASSSIIASDMPTPGLMTPPGRHVEQPAEAPGLTSGAEAKKAKEDLTMQARLASASSAPDLVKTTIAKDVERERKR